MDPHSGRRMCGISGAETPFCRQKRVSRSTGCRLPTRRPLASLTLVIITHGGKCEMPGRQDEGPASRLRHERELRGWSQAEVARRLGAPSQITVSRWERGVVVPSSYYRQRLCQLFGRSAVDLGFASPQPEVGYLPEPPTP